MLAGPAYLITVGKTSAEKRLLRADTVWEAKSPRTARNSTVQLGRSGEERESPHAAHTPLPPLTVSQGSGPHQPSLSCSCTWKLGVIGCPRSKLLLINCAPILQPHGP